MMKPKEEIAKEGPSLSEQIKPIVAEQLETVNKKIDDMKTTQNQALEKILLKIKSLEDILKPG